VKKLRSFNYGTYKSLFDANISVYLTFQTNTNSQNKYWLLLNSFPFIAMKFIFRLKLYFKEVSQLEEQTWKNKSNNFSLKNFKVKNAISILSIMLQTGNYAEKSISRSYNFWFDPYQTLLSLLIKLWIWFIYVLCHSREL